MNIDRSEVFNFNNDILNDQILRTYIECVVKYNTLDWFLYYEDFFISHTNTSLLNLNTSMKSISISEYSTQKEKEHYFRYLKACHLGVEYIEHSLKLLFMLEGHDIKEIKRLGLGHDLEKHFEMLNDEEVKSMIMGSIGIYQTEYIESVLNGIPTNITFQDYTDEEKKDFDYDLELIEKVLKKESLTPKEKEHYDKLDQLMNAYEEHKYDLASKVSNKYFNAILKVLSNSFVDLRYPEVSKTNDYYNLAIILSICNSIRTILTSKIESSRIFEFEKSNIEEYVNKILNEDTEHLNYTIDNDIVILDRPLTLYEQNKMKASNKAKYEALMWYMYGMEEFYLSGKTDYSSSLVDILYSTSITRERINKKSNDKLIYENYLYYQACHMACDFIEHSLKLLLLNNGYSYKEIKDKFGHDFKKMYYSLTETEQKDISGILSYFNDNYLQNASIQNSNFRDVIKYTLEEKNIGINKFIDSSSKRDSNEKLTLQNFKYLDAILTQIADAFKFTRYPDFYNYNMNYKYCLKFLLAFAQGLQSNIEQNLNISYSNPTFDSNEQINKGTK